MRRLSLLCLRLRLWRFGLRSLWLITFRTWAVLSSLFLSRLIFIPLWTRFLPAHIGILFLPTLFIIAFLLLLLFLIHHSGKTILTNYIGIIHWFFPWDTLSIICQVGRFFILFVQLNDFLYSIYR